MKKRLLSMFLAVVMLISLLPTTAFTLDLSSEESPVPVYSAAYAADVVVDGALQESGWVTNGKMASAESYRSYGALWKSGTVYFAVKLDTADTKVTIVLNETEITVTESGVSGVQGASSAWADGVVEIAIPTAEAGFSICDYTQTVPFAISVGDNAFEGKLGFNSVVRAESNLDAGAYVESYNHGEDHAGEFDFAQSTAVENGYTIQLKQENNNPTFYDIHRTATAANALDTSSGAVTVEFDLNVESLTAIAGGRIGQYWSSEGVVIWVSDNSGKQLVYSVYYAKDHKLYMSYCQGPHGGSIGTPICLDKTLKETFRLRVDFRADGSGEVYVDGVRKGFMENALLVARNSAMPANSIRFHAFEYGKPENTNEFTFSNIAVGTSMGGSVLDQVDFGAIKADNTSANAITSDLSLLASVSNSQLGEQPLTWTSSMTDVIANDGKVKRNADNNTVTLTAALTNCPAIKKDLALVVSRLRTEAYATKYDMIVDGIMDESFWGTVNPMTGANAGNLFGTYQASWSRQKLYLGLTHKNATKAEVSLGQWLQEIDLTGNGVVDGVTVGSSSTSVPIITWDDVQPTFDIANAIKQTNNANNIEVGDSAKMNATAITNGVKLYLEPSGVLAFRERLSLPVAAQTLDRSNTPVVVEFDVNIKSMATYGNSSMGWVQPGYGLQIRVTDKDNMLLMLNVTRGNGTAGAADKLYLRYNYAGGSQSASAIELTDAGINDLFKLRLVWSKDDSLGVYIDGTLVTTIANATYTNVSGINSDGMGSKPNTIEFRLDNYHPWNTGRTKAEVEITNLKTGNMGNATAWDANAIPFTGEGLVSNPPVTSDSSHIKAGNINGFKMHLTPTSGADNEKLLVPLTGLTLDRTSSDLVMEFDVRINSMPNYGYGSPTWVVPSYGLQLFITDNNPGYNNYGYTVALGITLGNGIGSGDANKLYLNNIYGQGGTKGTAVDLGKGLGEKFRMRLVWTTGNAVQILIDGVEVGTLASGASTFIGKGSLGMDFNKIEFRLHNLNARNTNGDSIDVDIMDVKLGSQSSGTITWNTAVPNFADVAGTVTTTATDYEISKTNLEGINLAIDAETEHSFDTSHIYANNVNLEHSNSPRVVSYDVRINKMPVYTLGAKGGMWPCYGLTGNLTDANDDLLNYGITNTEDGLYFCYNIADSDAKSVVLGKKVGDKFNLTLIWNTDDTVAVQVDGQTIATLTDATRSRTTGYKRKDANVVEFHLKDVNNNAADVDIINFRLGTVETVVNWHTAPAIDVTKAVEHVYNLNAFSSASHTVDGTDGSVHMVINPGNTTARDRVLVQAVKDNMVLDRSNDTLTFEFDINIASMAKYGIGRPGGSLPTTGGLRILIADSNSKMLMMGITRGNGNTEDNHADNLYLKYNYGNSNEGQTINLGKAVGETFTLKLMWSKDDQLEVFVDGALVATIANASYTGNIAGDGMAANRIEFRLDNIRAYNTSLTKLEATVSNLKVGKVSDYDVTTVTELEIPLDLANIQLEDYGEGHRFQVTLLDEEGHAISSEEFPVDMVFIGDKWDAVEPSFNGVQELTGNPNVAGEYAHISKTDIADGFNMHVDAETVYSVDTLRVYAQNVMLDHTQDNKLISFDININKMPVYTAGNWGGWWPCRGLTARAADNNGNMMVFGITNTAEGLVFCIKGSEWKSAALGKQIGEQFNLRLIWNADNSLTVQVDGRTVRTFTAAEAIRATSGLTAGNFEFWVFDPTENGEIDIAITNFRTGTPLPFNCLAEEVALENLVNVDLNNITGDFVLPDSFESPYLGTVPLAWESSSETIMLKADGTAKVYRPGGRVPEYAFLTLTAFEDKEVYTREVKVAAMQEMVEQNITKLNAAFTTDPITVDGAAEIGWNLNSKVLKDGILGGKFGAQWDMDNLYLLFETDKALTVTLNGNNIDLSNAVAAAYTEVKIPLSDLGVTVKDYGEKINAKIEMGGFIWEGIIELTSTDWFITDNVGNGIDKPVQGGYTNNSSPKNTDISDILKIDGNGYYLYDHFVAGLENPSQMTSYIQLGKKNADDTFYAPLGDLTADTYLEFDLFFKNMPVWAQSANTNISRNPVSYAFNYFITGNKNELGEAPSISVGIINTEEGLLLLVHEFPENEVYRSLNSVLLGRSVGDTFRLGTRWNTDDGSVSIFVDGEQIAAFEQVAADRAMDENRVQMQITRNKDLPDTSNENMDIYVTNIAFGKSNGDSLFDDLTFDTIKGENEDPYKVTSGLELPETLGENTLGIDGALTWESSNAGVIKADGTVVRPESAGVLVKLTAKIPGGAEKVFELYVPATDPTGLDTMAVVNDSNTANGAGKLEDLYQFKLDESNNSIILDLGESKRINVITLTDGDDITRLNESSLSVWVSDDNVTYKRVEDDFKILRKGDKTYLYDFEAEGRYIKVHCTHYYGDEADFVGPLQGMLKAEYQEVFGDAGAEFKSEITVTVTNDKNYVRYDDAFRFAKADAVLAGVDSASIRVFLGDELLYHYVDGDDIVVRIPEIKANGSVELKVLSKNPGAMDISNKEYVHEVVYGTRELITLPNLCRYFEVLPNGAIFTATGYQDPWNIGNDEGLPYYTTRYVGYSLSYDGGLTWTDHVKIEESYGGGDPNVLGWMSGMEGVLYDPTIGENGRLIITGFTNPGVGGLVQRFMYSDDLCKTWHRSNEAIFDGNPTTYYLGYTSPIRLTTADGEGPEVDYVMPVGSKDQREEAITDLACRVMYSTDAGITWRVSETVLTNADAQLGIVGGEGGMSEASIMECDDGRLVLYCRNQGKNENFFVRAYSEDKGITWGPVELTNVYTVNTQPMLYNYGDNKLLFWSGNNSLGGESGLRYPLNVGVSDDDWKTFGNIQDLFNRYSLQGMVESYCFKVTNPDMVVFDDVLTIAWNNHGVGNTIVMRVDDFYDFLYRTKGAFDSFENSTFKYEGWTKTSGLVEASPEKATDGNKSMKIFGNSSAVRSIPYIQNGNVEFDLYVEDVATANFALELQAAFNTTTGKSSAPISLEVKNGVLTFRRSEVNTGIALTDGWNKIRFELDLAADTAAAKLNVNGTEVQIPLLGEAFYICYAYIVNSSTEAVYMDSFMVTDTMQVELPEKPHSPVKTDKVDPTCTEDGMEAHWTCQTCGKVFTDGLCQNEVTDMNDLVIEKHSHDLKKFDANKENCTEDGNVEYYYCSICKKNFDAEGKELEKIVVDAHGHSLKKTDAKKPTCTDEGNVEYYYCSICKKYFDAEGKELTKVTIDAHGHDLKKTEAKQESCTGEGNVEYYTCSVCKKHFNVNGKELTEITIDAHGHKLNKTEAKAPTCIEDGNVEYYTCTVCGKIFDAAGKELTEVTVPKLTGHAFGEWKVVKEAVPGQDGEKQRVCSVCGHKETAVVTAEGTKTNPVVVGKAEDLTEVEVQAGGEVHYALDKDLADMVLTVKGEGAYVIVNGAKTEGKNGVVEVKLEAKDGKISVIVGNAGAKAATFSITIATPDPDNSDTGDNAAIVLFGSLMVLSVLAAGALLIPDIRKRLFK